MFRPFDFCLPTRSTIVPHGPDWLHEVKYDGYHLRRMPPFVAQWRGGPGLPAPSPKARGSIKALVPYCDAHLRQPRRHPAIRKGHVMSKYEKEANNTFRPSDKPLTEYEQEQKALHKEPRTAEGRTTGEREGEVEGRLEIGNL
jgi:hypothetical protein